MGESAPSRFFAMVQRELQEYKTSLVITPIVTAVLLTLVMVVSVLLAGRISAMGDAIMQVLLLEDSASGMNISIQIDEDSANGDEYSYTIESNGSVSEEDWNFSREWTFNPRTRDKAQVEDAIDDQVDTLNPMLSVLHYIMVFVLIMVSINYLLGTLFEDRKDRSFLFWRSMPVSEWEEVSSKLLVALLVAPVIFIALSMVMQLAYVLLSMLLVWRMELDPGRLILGNIEFSRLLFDQLSGWVLSALLIAPFYAWLMLASAGAKRSPAFFAVALPIGLILLEEFFLGTEMLRSAIANHVPHATETSSVAFYVAGPNWAGVNYLSLVLGLVTTVILLWGAVYCRRYRWEI
ncbi:hypothetical protein [Parahalioglobus pacificus]|uniref:ABC transporter permease n=1 Tax=Parahalioglobus pacificus TaxID=930806 RepID=A0A919CI59_9GAMM|nr:hypothetical protein [Halioglobus pacificus]GHD27042.1 hypothetical protein GCM10007053_04840 [Halioglobus pacificus]